MSTDNGNGRVTLAKVYETVAPIELRVRRLEYLVVALLVTTASPKLGGPTPVQVGAWLVHLFTP